MSLQNTVNKSDTRLVHDSDNNSRITDSSGLILALVTQSYLDPHLVD